MDDIQERLEAAVNACKEGYAKWRANPKDTEAREKLAEYAHELRRIGARLEIELAVAERNVAREMPIPIPAHRAAGRREKPQVAPEGNARSENVVAADAANVEAVKPRRIADGLKPSKRSDKALSLNTKVDEGAENPAAESESGA